MNTTRVLALLPLFVVLAQSFSWDIVMGAMKKLEFFYNGTLTHTEDIPSANTIFSITYDPVHSKVLFVDYDYHISKFSIYSFDPITKKIQTLVTRLTKLECILNVAYDPVTQLLFWNENKKIYSLSLKPASSDKTVGENILVSSYSNCANIAVDSCGGFIYWVADNKIERAAFDGTEREVLIDDGVVWRRKLVIDHQTQTMYWVETTHDDQITIQSADLNGKNINTFYYIGKKTAIDSLTVSKDFIYWRSYSKRVIFQLQKNRKHDVAPTVYSQCTSYCMMCQLIAANYKIEKQTLGIKSCEALKSLELDVEEQNSSICHNYCSQGNCSVSAEGHPKCRCNAGYSGERCDLYACHEYCSNNGVCSLNEEEKPVCQCTVDYQGERCDVTTTHTGACDCADKMTQQMLLDLRSEVKQVREDLKSILQLYTDKLDENATKIQISGESRNDDQKNNDETISKPQKSSVML